MGFFDTYKDIGGGAYVGADEKDVLIENGIPVQIMDVVYQEESQYGERFVCKVILPNEDAGAYDDERLMSFGVGSVESRDRMLNAMMEYLDEGGDEPIWVKFNKVGRAVIIEKADAPTPPKKTRARASK